MPTGPIYTDAECELEALPKKGGVNGTTRASDGGTVAGATITLTDATGATHTATTGPDGAFSFKDLPLGSAKISAQATDFMPHKTETIVRPREDVRVVMTLNKFPKIRHVRVVGKHIRVNRKIHFELNSATIKGDSHTLLGEITAVILKNPNLKRIEVQGHTDNTGSRAGNIKLSQDRADAVRTWLSKNGVEGSRLVAKGYGQSRPLAPNVTPANRARNRRVQLVILEKE
jgi:outer membrane protein OmpA-like peptidoglycan-associated protein